MSKDLTEPISCISKSPFTKCQSLRQQCSNVLSQPCPALQYCVLNTPVADRCTHPSLFPKVILLQPQGLNSFPSDSHPFPTPQAFLTLAFPLIGLCTCGLLLLHLPLRDTDRVPLPLRASLTTITYPYQACSHLSLKQSPTGMHDPHLQAQCLCL